MTLPRLSLLATEGARLFRFHAVQSAVEEGINVTINTDDPSISRITLSNEYYNACDALQMPQYTLKERIVAAAQAGFLPDGEKENLVSQLKKELANKQSFKRAFLLSEVLNRKF